MDEEITLVVKAKLTYSPRRSENVLHMKFGDTTMDVTADGKKLGSVAACIGGGVEMQDSTTQETWTMDFRDLWYAFQQALYNKSDHEAQG